MTSRWRQTTRRIGRRAWISLVGAWNWIWPRVSRDVWSITRLLERSRLLRPIAEPLVVSVFLGASSLLLEEKTRVLDWLDVAMLAVVPAIEVWRLTPPRDVAPEILVLTVGSRFFETEFGGQTPIPRAAFRDLLDRLVTSFRPTVLAVDYDLSPGCLDLQPSQEGPVCGAALARDDESRQRLDHYLLSRPVPQLVLIRPLPVGDLALCTVREAWEARMRAGGVRFGEPDLVHHSLFDAVVKYETTTDTFASRVYCSAHPEGPRCAPHAGHAEPAAPAERTRCRTREQLREHPILKGNLDPLNFLHAMRGVPTYELTSLAAIEAARARHPGRFPVVFVGADHDSSDLFNTPVGERSGVALHAYAVYSMAHALPARHGWALVIDIVLGTVVGVGLHWSRGGRRTGQGPWERLWRAGLGVAIVGLAGALVLLGARGLMLSNMWINPGPLLGAIFVKTWLAHADTHHAPAAAPSVGDRLVGVFYCALLVAVLVETARIISHSH